MTYTMPASLPLLVEIDAVGLSSTHSGKGETTGSR